MVFPLLVALQGLSVGESDSFLTQILDQMGAPVVICFVQGLSHACQDQAFDPLLGRWLRTTVVVYPMIIKTDTSWKLELIRALRGDPAHVR